MAFCKSSCRNDSLLLALGRKPPFLICEVFSLCWQFFDTFLPTEEDRPRPSAHFCEIERSIGCARETSISSGYMYVCVCVGRCDSTQNEIVAIVGREAAVLVSLTEPTLAEEPFISDQHFFPDVEILQHESSTARPRCYTPSPIHPPADTTVLL